MTREEEQLINEQPLMLQCDCVECKWYDGFGQCIEHGNQLVDDCEDFEFKNLVMTPEDKDLLLKDLCARLPYGVKFKWCDGLHEDYYTFIGINEQYIIGRSTGGYEVLFIIGEDDVKPFLRPMSSMTEEEKMKLSLSQIYAFTHYNEIAKIDWLNAHHFDYRGLIDRGLAIEVTEDNNLY